MTPKLIGGILTCSMTLWAASDPLVGTWTINAQKSKYGARPMPKRSSETWSAQGGGTMKLTRDLTDAQGRERHGEWSGKFDGKEYRIRLTIPSCFVKELR